MASAASPAPCLMKLQRLPWLGLILLLALAGAEVNAAEVEERNPDGSLLAIRQLDAAGRPHGLSREYYPTGTLRAEKHYNHGLLHGTSRLYYPTGALQTEWSYREGKREGRGVGYYENGVLKDEGFYKNDQQEGLTRLYSSDGSLKAELTFKNGILEGTTKTYNPGGGINYIYTYRKGRIVRSQTFGPDGSLHLEQDYPISQVQP